MSAAVDRRLDEYLARAEERERRAIAERQAQEDAERRERAHRWRDSCFRWSETYADAFAALNMTIPPPLYDEPPARYRRKLAQALIDRLSRRSPLASVRADDCSTDVMAIVEPDLLRAAIAEGERPSFDNLPSDGTLIKRERVDPQTGERRVEWFGQKSFIASMMPPRRRAIIADPRALYGQARLARSFMPQSVVTVVG